MSSDEQVFEVAPPSKGMEVGNWQVYLGKVGAVFLASIAGAVCAEFFNTAIELIRGSGLDGTVKDALIALFAAGSVAVKRFVLPTNPSVIKVKE
jgi:hypothetical protein